MEPLFVVTVALVVGLLPGQFFPQRKTRVVDVVTPKVIELRLQHKDIRAPPPLSML